MASGDSGLRKCLTFVVLLAATRFLAFCDDEQLPVGVVHGCPGAWAVLVTARWQIAALLEPVLVRRILKEYSAVRPLSDAEREALVTAVPLRHCIDWLRIWNAVGNEEVVPFSWSEYLDGMDAELFEDWKWRELVMGAD